MLKWLFLLILWAETLIAATPIPPLTTPVMDTAAIIGDNTEQYLNDQLSRLWQQGGSQVAILTIPQLQDEAIEQYSIRVADQWKLGSAKGDNGVLVVIAAQDRKVRIEVGQGLEGDLPDVYASRIIREKMVPLFKESDYDAGVMTGLLFILRHTDPKYDFGMGQTESSSRSHRASSGSGGSSLLKTILIFVIIVLFIIVKVISSGLSLLGGLTRPHSYRGWHDRSYGGRGGFFGGGGSGGGGGFFGGGGGGFSGGGASGDW
jgi:uncharacterized protein